jgi:cysteine sulfinate desulfinase/cysteine desulfurase-like protein
MMGSVRFSLGHTTAQDDVDAAVEAAVESATRLTGARA